MTGTVLVSGGSGYIAGYLIRQLVAEGWTVHTTVRSLTRESEVRRTLAVDDAKLRFFNADLMADAGWAEAMAGCSHVAHVASPFPVASPKNDDELIVPARDGALRALRAAKAAGVQRFVMTSSSAAVGYGHGDRSRPFTEADALSYHALVSDPEVLRYTGESPITTVAQALDILRTRPLRDYAVHGFGRMACVLQETHELIGFCGLKRLEAFDCEVDIGYRFVRRCWGLGLATESAAALYAHGKEQLRLARIIGLVMPENTGSVRVLEKLGMQREKAIRFPGAECDFDLYV